MGLGFITEKATQLSPYCASAVLWKVGSYSVLEVIS